MEVQVFTVPWGNPREAEVEPKARSMPTLEHSTADKMIAERKMRKNVDSYLLSRDSRNKDKSNC
jgi:hypothetical protein